MAGRHCDITRGEKMMVTARMEQFVWLGVDKKTDPPERPTSTILDKAERPQTRDILMDQDVEMSGQASCLNPPPSSSLVFWIYCVHFYA